MTGATAGGGRRPVLSGPVMTRVGGVPVDALDIVGEPTRRLLADVARTGRRLAELAGPLNDALYAVVPRLDDDVALRREVLAGRRALHRLRTPRWTPETIEKVVTLLDEPAGDLLRTWVRLSQERTATLGELSVQVEHDREAALRILRAALDDPGVMASMAIAAPDWVRHGKMEAATPRTVKTLYSYVSRAAVKTSPFSGLTTVGVAGARAEGRALSRTAVALAMLAAQRLARDPATAALLRYRGAPVRPGGRDAPGGLLLHGETVNAGGVVWRSDRVMEADHAAPWLAGLPGGDLTLATVLDHLGGADPFARFRRLLDAGVLTIVQPWRQGEDPLAVLATLMDGVPAGPIGADELRAAHTRGAQANRASAKERLAALADLDRFARAWARPSHGRPAPSALLYEDREADGDLPDVTAHEPVAEDLRALGERMRPAIFRSHVYDLLVDSFVAEFGAGGVCDDPLGFLLRLSIERDANPPLDAAIAADLTRRGDPGERAWLPVGPTSAPPSAAVLFQLAADGHDSVARGNHRLVVNQFSAGGGGLFSRFTGLLGEGFRDRLREHVIATRPGVACREFVVWSDCNTAQAMCGGLLPPLLLPGEPAAEHAITLDDTRLVHDAATDTLSLVDLAGEPIGLAYLGLVPQHTLQSYVRLLAVLADPWVNGSSDSDYTMTRMPELMAGCHPEQVVALPRVSEGRLVLRRASWLAPVASLPLPRAGESDADLVVRMDAFRRAHGMPEEVFVHQVGGQGFYSAAHRKPLWASWVSPTSGAVLAGWLDAATTHVRITEALPDRRMQPQRDDQGRRRASEHAAVLVWPKEHTP
ncbi:hypothetical protein Skr01_21650 [Sphaerisporangium krabiense]|uniref:Lantibiotic dehydratase N-terminal domain-containing protein n=1 Tax=Sphaerisporangium krabiense TaxID=763782 RepID=A0A7W8Z5V7_9ACTN|nr:lantibiotic dehydratase [Sphaerisporangium krabiense]MBB5627920.1 hypothetical protein [Sphaerisporangium krabiense]GII62080.1 hypothetical protein Skr01_21650 [Sphaerisporangium krabiense]